MNALLNDGGELKHDHAHYKLKRMICNENAVKFVEGRIAAIWVEFDSAYNYNEMAVFFSNLVNMSGGLLVMMMMVTSLMFQKNCTFGVK